MAAEDDGFLSRWSKRKAQERAGAPPLAGTGVPPAAVQTMAPAPDGVSPPAAPQPVVTDPGDPPSRPEASAQWTLDDVRALTSESDFSPFVSAEVPPEVRNAAMKKLFSDPAFNVMDGLDIYIDDYSRPDPLPAGLARQLVSAQFMKLFDAPPEAGDQPPQDQTPIVPGPHAVPSEADGRTPTPEAGLEPGAPEDAATPQKPTEP
jgi:hypothetical protein